MSSTEYINQFKRNVRDKYIIYNSLFAALPYSGIANVGVLLPILFQACKEGYQDGKSPMQIIDHFFSQHHKVDSEKEQIDRLFKFVQYIERQVVLFDAIEDAAFTTVNNMDGAGSMKALFNEASFAGKKQALKNKLRKFSIRIVLTAHPTQFYPSSILGIIHDMHEAIEQNDFHTINRYIQQLGLTPFFNKKQPTPLDEAQNLIWYLENVFYHSIGDIYNFIESEIFDGDYDGENSFIQLGFWPGGDRDGNPYVNAGTTVEVANLLRTAITKCYYRDVQKLKRWLTFTGVEPLVEEIENQLYQHIFLGNVKWPMTKAHLLASLNTIRELVVTKHHSLYLSRLDSFIHKVKIFGTHFASLDIRQDSRTHSQVLMAIDQALKASGEKGIFDSDYPHANEMDQINMLYQIDQMISPNLLQEGINRDTLESIFAIQEVQAMNGEAGCHRYIISNCQSAINVIEVFALCKLCGWNTAALTIDIVPLFETIDDLEKAESIMESLYTHNTYQQHLQFRNNQQTIMLGFSDGTKDGGYLQANWRIYNAKENLSAISKKHQVKVKFFDGRGGPPSRGGGKTNKFYASLGSQIENQEIQLTVQGQTITSNFGTIQSSKYNLEQLLSAGISNELFFDPRKDLSQHDRSLLEELGAVSFKAYQHFKEHPLFMGYLQKFSPLNYYSKSNIASRPSKRGSENEKLAFKDLRAVPFVGSWSQLKQNVPGYFGVGTALQHMKDKGLWEDVKAMYRNVLFFRTLIDNSMMSMLKSSFALTSHIQSDTKYAEIWQMLYSEFTTTQLLVLDLSDTQELMQEDKTGRASILMRDQIVLPLLTIQQYALYQLNKTNADLSLKEDYEKLVTRSMFGIINAARNSA